MNKRTAVVKCLSIMALALLVCSMAAIPGAGATKDAITIEFFHYQWLEAGKKDILGEIVDEFERQFPSIRVKRTPVSFTQTRDILFTRIAGGTAPDVAVVLHDSIGKMMASNYLEPLSDYIDLSPVKDKLVGSTELARGKDGSIYAIAKRTYRMRCSTISVYSKKQA